MRSRTYWLKIKQYNSEGMLERTRIKQREVWISTPGTISENPQVTPVDPTSMRIWYPLLPPHGIMKLLKVKCRV